MKMKRRVYSFLGAIASVAAGGLGMGLACPLDARGALLERASVALIAGFQGSDPSTAREFERGMKVFSSLHPELSQRMKLRTIDNAGNPLKMLEVLQTALAQGTKIFVGPANSDEALAAGKLIEERQSLLITPFATNPKITEGRTRVFRTCFSDDRQGRALAEFAARDLKLTSIKVLINQDSHYSQGLAKAFIERFRQLAPKARLDQFLYARADYRWGVLQTELAQAVPQAVFIPDHVTHAGILSRKISEAFPSVTLFGGDGWGGKQVFHALHSGKVSGSIYYSTHWDEGMPGPRAKRFVREYRRQNPGVESVSVAAAMAFDAFVALGEAMRRWPGPTDDPSLAKLVHALERTQAAGSGGGFGFSPGADHTPRRPVVMISVRDGAYRVHRVFEAKR